MELVINEWFPEYLRPGTPPESRKQAVQFFQTFYKRGDVLVVKQDSAFIRKVYGFDKAFQYDLDSKDLFKQFISLVLRDSKRCRLLQNTDIEPLPDSVLRALIPPYNSDTYLFEAAMHSSDRIIITTDDRLVAQTLDNGFIRVVLLEDFLASYSS